MKTGRIIAINNKFYLKVISTCSCRNAGTITIVKRRGRKSFAADRKKGSGRLTDEPA